MSRPATPFALGPWHVDPSANEVRRGADTVRLEPKTMAVLAELAARPGEVVPREALAAAVWPGVVVTEASLTRCVSQLRQALADDPRSPQIIETVPTVGYRLLVPPVPLGARPAPASPGRAPSRRLAGAAIAAVLVGVAVWTFWPSPVVVTYRIDTVGDVGTLVVRTTRGDGSVATEHLDTFPVTREVRTHAAGEQRYEIRATGTARTAEVTATVVARKGGTVLARSWATQSASTGRPQPLTVHTHVDVE